jgi:hypothetical protein
MGNSSSYESISKQEHYVNSNLKKVKNTLIGSKYSDAQIRGKLRNEYHGCNNDKYILKKDWNSVKNVKKNWY